MFSHGTVLTDTSPAETLISSPRRHKRPKARIQVSLLIQGLRKWCVFQHGKWDCILPCFRVAEVARCWVDGMADVRMDSLPEKRVSHKKPLSS